ncbi:MAG: NAD(P)-binding protein [Haloarculaceae archaeon]
MSLHKRTSADGNRQSSEPTSDERTRPDYYVLGGGSVGKAVARRLRSDGHTVGFVDEMADPDGSDVRGDPSELSTLERSSVAEASTAVVAGSSDRRNFLIAQLLATHFDVPRVLVRVNDPERADVLGAAGHEPVCAASVLATAIAEDV